MGVSLPCSRLRRKAAALNGIVRVACGDMGVSLPCSRLRRKAAALNGIV
jgi:hypothetical protein